MENKKLTLSEDEFQQYYLLSERWAKGLIDHELCTEGWKFLHHKNNSDCYLKYLEGNPICLIKGSSEFVGEIEDIKRVMFRVQTSVQLREEMQQVDPMCTDACLLFGRFMNEDNLLQIGWNNFNLAPGGILWERDFFFLQRFGILLDEPRGQTVAVAVCGSIERDDVPELTHLRKVRGSIQNTGYVFRDIGGGNIRVTYVVQVDPKGVIPPWAISIVSQSQAENAGRMAHRATEAYKASEIMGVAKCSCEPIKVLANKKWLLRLNTFDQNEGYQEVEAGEVANRVQNMAMDDSFKKKQSLAIHIIPHAHNLQFEITGLHMEDVRVFTNEQQQWTHRQPLIKDHCYNIILPIKHSRSLLLNWVNTSLIKSAIFFLQVEVINEHNALKEESECKQSEFFGTDLEQVTSTNTLGLVRQDNSVDVESFQASDTPENARRYQIKEVSPCHNAQSSGQLGEVQQSEFDDAKSCQALRAPLKKQCSKSSGHGGVHGGMYPEMLFQAVCNRHIQVVELLLANGSLIEERNPTNSYTVLLQASEMGLQEVVALLLEMNANTEATSKKGQTPLMLAARSGHSEIVQLLLKKGAKSETKCAEGWTAAMYAARHGQSNIVEMLLNHATSSAKEMNTLLILASRYGQLEVVPLLLDWKADVEASNEFGNTALMEAASQGLLEAVQLLHQKGACISSSNSDGWTPLLHASCRGHTQVVQFLLQHGADASATNHRGKTALMEVESLLQISETGANVGFGAGDEIEVCIQNGSEWLPAQVIKKGEDRMYTVSLSDGSVKEGIQPENARTSLKLLARQKSTANLLRQALLKNKKPAHYCLEQQSVLNIGDCVEVAKDGNSKWRSCRVRDVRKDGTYGVIYRNGTSDERVLPENIRIKKEKQSVLSIGDCVEVATAGNSKWIPGRVRDIGKDGTYGISYQNGTSDERVLPENIRSRKEKSAHWSRMLCCRSRKI